MSFLSFPRPKTILAGDDNKSRGLLEDIPYFVSSPSPTSPQYNPRRRTLGDPKIGWEGWLQQDGFRADIRAAILNTR